MMNRYMNILLSVIVTGVLSGCQSGVENSGGNATAGSNGSTASTGSSTGGSGAESQTTLTKEGWYMRTTVKVTTSDGKVYEHKTAGVFGELADSEGGKDRHDIPSMGSINRDVKLYVLFTPDWEAENTTYFSDYHRYGESDPRVWTFQVVSPLSDAALTLNIDGVFDVYKKAGEPFVERPSSDESLKNALHLVDLDNQKVYTYDELANADLTMDGKTARSFRWVIGPVSDQDMELPLKLQAAESKTALQADFVEQPLKSQNGFGLPPE